MRLEKLEAASVERLLLGSEGPSFSIVAQVSTSIAT
jgi:hypothetical protein